MMTQITEVLVPILVWSALGLIKDTAVTSDIQQCPDKQEQNTYKIQCAVLAIVIILN